MLHQSSVVIESQNLRTYFCEELTRASENQSLQVDEEVFAYLIELLTAFNNPNQLFDQTAEGLELKPLALHYASAVSAETKQQRNLALRRLGDVALFISGLFPASLNRKVMDVDYYVAMGGTAYSYLYDVLNADVFGQLASNFPKFVDLLAEITENSPLKHEADLMRDYEMWMRTGSSRSFQRLERRGLMPSIYNISAEQH